LHLINRDNYNKFVLSLTSSIINQKTIILLAFLFLISCQSLPKISEENNIFFNAEYFGNHIHSGQRFPELLNELEFKTWRLWDTGTDWTSIEPENNNWNFETLDQLVSIAEQNDKEIILTLGITPSWAAKNPDHISTYGGLSTTSEPRNISDWNDYIRTLGLRYKGRIKYWEIWNEPDLYIFYTGSISKMVEMTQTAHTILKEIDNENKIISPSITGWLGITLGLNWLHQYLSMGAKDFVDIIGYHSYNDSFSKPEDLYFLLNQVKEILYNLDISKPIWNTEGGYYDYGTPREMRASIMARMLILYKIYGIERFCWYSINNTRYGTLYDRKRKVFIESGLVYKHLIDLLEGSQIINTSLDNNIYSLLLSKDGKRYEILWTKFGNRTINRIENNFQIYDLQGRLVNYINNSIEITETPIIIISD